jgi:hypothetical protein
VQSATSLWDAEEGGMLSLAFALDTNAVYRLAHRILIFNEICVFLARVPTLSLRMFHIVFCPSGLLPVCERIGHST